MMKIHTILGLTLVTVNLILPVHAEEPGAVLKNVVTLAQAKHALSEHGITPDAVNYLKSKEDVEAFVAAKASQPNLTPKDFKGVPSNVTQQ